MPAACHFRHAIESRKSCVIDHHLETVSLVHPYDWTGRRERMTFRFKIERTSWKSRNLIYQEDGRLLKVYLEMSGVRKLDWVGSDTSFQEWTIPAGERISREKQAEILDRLASWARAERLRIDIGPPVDMEACFSEYEKKGWSVERRPDGTTIVSPPAKPSLLSRALGAG